MDDRDRDRRNDRADPEMLLAAETDDERLSGSPADGGSDDCLA